MDLLSLATPEPGAILALQARVDRDEAAAIFARGLAGGVRRLRLGPLRSVAHLHVPFRLHDVLIGPRRRRERMVLGLDAVTGALDLYRFDDVPPSAVVPVRTGNHPEPALSPSATRDIVAARLKRMLYQRVGFLAIGGCHLDVQPVGPVLHVPYWLGFFGRGETASIVAMDAVRRQIEGVKLRRLVDGWLRESAAV